MPRVLAALRQQEIIEHVMLTAYLAELTEWDNRGHVERIRRYAYILASDAGFGHEEAELASIACMLHDVGKITQPVSILKKTANLEPEEYKIAEGHTTEGARILRGSSSPVLEAAATIALTHHERWDGSGYPSGLQGEYIPVTGRIMAVADVFDALTTKRSYKTEVGPEAARELIETSSGSLFDPKLVAAFSASFADFKSVLHLHTSRSTAER